MTGYSQVVIEQARFYEVAGPEIGRLLQESGAGRPFWRHCGRVEMTPIPLPRDHVLDSIP